MMKKMMKKMMKMTADADDNEEEDDTFLKCTAWTSMDGRRWTQMAQTTVESTVESNDFEVQCMDVDGWTSMDVDVWYGMVWYGMDGMVWYGMVWYAMV